MVRKWLLPVIFMLVSSLTVPGLSGIGIGIADAQKQSKEKTLYDRLGGYDAISAVVDVFLEKVWADPEVGRFFIGMGTDTRNQLRQKNKNLLCYNTGGPCKKINRPLKFAHEGLGITNKEFDIVVNHLAGTLKEFNVPQREQQEVMAKVGGLRPYIVEVKAKE